MLKIEIPADQPDLIRAIGRGLASLGSAEVVLEQPEVVKEQPEQPEVVPEQPEVVKEQQEQPEVVKEQQEQPEVVKEQPEVVLEQLEEPPKADMKGVGFERAYCGVARVPFYASGKREGQWKKRQGIDDVAYDAWYAKKLKAVPQETPEETVDTASAFGGDAEPDTDVGIPQVIGQFMGWVAQEQAAGNLTAEQVTEAYANEGVEITDLFPPANGDKVAEHIKRMYLALTR